MRKYVFLLAALALSGCLGAGVEGPALTVAGTTSLRDTGFLDHLADGYLEAEGVRLRFVVAGTGQALRHAAEGDVDATLTHSPEREEALVASGAGLWRRPVMHNDYVLVGPPGDPAGARAAANATEALRAVHAAGAPFASRADASGTHDREVALWRAAGLDPTAFDPAWYVETGSGQAQTLRVAHERGAYALTDEATFLKLRAVGDLPRLDEAFRGDPALRNPYAVVPVSNATRPDVRTGLAVAFAEWLAGPEGQALVADYRVHGRPLFTPNAHEVDA